MANFDSYFLFFIPFKFDLTFHTNAHLPQFYASSLQKVFDKTYNIKESQFHSGGSYGSHRESYVSHIGVIYERYVSHTGVIYESYVSHMGVIHEAYVSHTWLTCEGSPPPYMNTVYGLSDVQSPPLHVTTIPMVAVCNYVLGYSSPTFQNKRSKKKQKKNRQQTA